MIIFILGEDIYQSQKRLLDLKNKFKQKYGDINLSFFDIEKNNLISAAKIISQIDSVPFLGAKRLVVVLNLLANGEQKMKEIINEKIKNISESSIIIFFEKGVPKSDKLYKNLTRLAKVENYPLKRGLELINWVKEEVIARGGKIEEKAAQKLVNQVGGDAWRLSNEIDKLINFSHPKPISANEVEMMVAEKIQVKIFDLIDDLARRDEKMAIKSMHKLLALGEKEIYLLSMMAFGFRNLILIKYLNNKNPNLNQVQMAKALSLHPFVVSKSYLAAKLFKFKELKKIYHKLILANLKMRQKDQDPRLVLDLLVSDICQKPTFSS